MIAVPLHQRKLTIVNLLVIHYYEKQQIMSLMYWKAVLYLHITPLIFVSFTRSSDKNNPNKEYSSIMIERYSGAALACTFATVIVQHWRPENVNPLQFLGLRINGLFPATIFPLLLTMILALGPIVLLLFNHLQKKSKQNHNVMNNSAKFYRYVLLAPACEEIVFRCCMVGMMISFIRPLQAMLFIPVYFSIAHMHHAFDQLDFYNDWRKALIVNSERLVLTYIFGVYTTFIYLRTYHFASVYLCHVFCNFIGLPDLRMYFMLQKRWMRVTVIVCTLIGICIWAKFLLPLTEPSLYANTFSEF
ncbi:CAAX prenyl protease 2 [Trichinella zimbabwensis]|uniref:CAAX prenyl protease 2 n=1 Tax=Trichinella zimbabwensis TaxID=268475 RepID=A0A0V1H3A1_9BILA|nr:CAAX prenyl protease 2 [Trichinella zimbabwensis]